MPLHDDSAPFDHTAAEAVSEGVYYVDTSRQILFWNASAERLSGHSAGEVQGRRCYDNLLRHVDAAGNELCFSGCPLAATIVDGRTREADVFLHHRAGHRQAIRVKTAPVRNDAGTIVGAVEVFTDGGELKRVEARMQELEQLAMVDSLTGVGNRRFLDMVLQTRLEELRRYGWPFGVLLIDLDKFKRINAQYGHGVGDQALKMVATTLSHCSRATDAVGRWGGDEFVVVVANADDAGLACASERIRTLVEHSALDTDAGPVRATVSIGGALAAAGTTIEDLLRQADKRVYTAKSRGRNCAAVAAA
ncbi:MAG: diguanylate cyclase [Vicinamibacterales bacterium]|nr:diguanylate cyclase [Vicinamibacterales bacterium]